MSDPDVPVCTLSSHLIDEGLLAIASELAKSKNSYGTGLNLSKLMIYLQLWDERPSCSGLE
jgi:hypothetical protein